MTSNDTNPAPQNPMQENIRGYRKFDQATSNFINDVKAAGDHIDRLLQAAPSVDADPHLVALARARFQEGAMWLIRSAAKPDGLF